jgi:hypothetical protein
MIKWAITQELFLDFQTFLGPELVYTFRFPRYINNTKKY